MKVKWTATMCYVLKSTKTATRWFILRWLIIWLTDCLSIWRTVCLTYQQTDHHPKNQLLVYLTTHQQTDWTTDCLTERLNYWLTVRLTDKQSACLTGWHTVCLLVCLSLLSVHPSVWPNYRLINWLTDKPTNWLIVCATEWLTKWFFV